MRSGAGGSGRALQGQEAGLAQTDPAGGQPKQGLGDRGEVRVVADDQAVAAARIICGDDALDGGVRMLVPVGLAYDLCPAHLLD